MKKLLSLLVVATLAVPVFAADSLHGSVTADFKVKATVDSFTGKATSLPFEIKKGDEKVTVTFEIAKMETGKKKRDTEMMHMFHADEFPTITGTASAASIRALKPSDEAVEIPVDVVMHAITKTVAGKITNVTHTGSDTSFDLEFPLVLSEFDLKAPSIMMMIKVADVVQVSSRVTLTEKAPVPDDAAK
jgi:polyisoprenoid-binding protein YceI